MANNLGITEVLLADLALSANYDSLMPGTQRKIVRVMGHVADTAAEEDDPDKMAIFECAGRGYPWVKKDNVLVSVVHVGATPPTNATVIFPDWDYTEF